MCVIEMFRSYLLLENKKKTTISTYVYTLQAYSNWIKLTQTDSDQLITRQHILAYRQYLMKEKGISNNSINHALRVLSKFNKFLILSDQTMEIHVVKSDFLTARLSSSKPLLVSKSDVDNFMTLVIKHASERDYLVIQLLFFTSLSLTEILNIKLRDVNLQLSYFEFVQGDCNKRIRFNLNTELLVAYNNYLSVRYAYTSSANSPYLFVSQKSHKLSSTVINKLFRKLNAPFNPSCCRKHNFLDS